MSAVESRLTDALPALESFLTRSAGAQVARTIEVRPLSGGAIQENWLLAVDFTGGAFDGRQDLVLRTDAPTAVAASLPRAQEFAAQRAAWQAGVTVAEPLWLCQDPGVLGRVFYVMRRVAGEALGRRVVAESALGGDRSALAERLGRELARLHAIVPPRPRPSPPSLVFPPPPPLGVSPVPPSDARPFSFLSSSFFFFPPPPPPPPFFQRFSRRYYGSIGLMLVLNVVVWVVELFIF